MTAALVFAAGIFTGLTLGEGLRLLQRWRARRRRPPLMLVDAGSYWLGRKDAEKKQRWWS